MKKEELLKDIDKVDISSFTKKELEEYMKCSIDTRNNIKKDFEETTKENIKLKELFKDKNVDYTNISVARAIIGGIALRNYQRDNNNFEGELEENPFSKKETEMMDTYSKLVKFEDKIEQYAEYNLEDEDMEM